MLGSSAPIEPSLRRAGPPRRGCSSSTSRSDRRSRHRTRSPLPGRAAGRRCGRDGAERRRRRSRSSPARQRIDVRAHPRRGRPRGRPSTSRREAAAAPVRLQQLEQWLPTRPARRPPRARAPEPSPRSSSPRARAPAGRRRAPRRRRPGCACAASSKNRPDRRPRPRQPRRPRSGRAARRRVAILAITPSAAPSAAAKRTGRSRIVCHGERGAASSSCVADLGDHVEAAIAERRERADGAAELHRELLRRGQRRDRRGRRRGRPATPPPSARTSSAAPAAAASGRSSASRGASPRARHRRRPCAPRSIEQRAQRRRATSMIAVSTMSWLVAPRWRCAAAFSPIRSRSARSSPGTGCARLAVERASASRSKALASHARSELLSRGSGGHSAADERAGERELDIEHRLNDRAVS